MSESSFKVIKPLEISDDILISTNVSEAEYAEWSGATTYFIGDRVISTSNHKVYESLRANNYNYSVNDPLWWIEVSPTNRWKLFDTSNSTQTVQATNISYTLRPTVVVTSLAILNFTGASSVQVQVTHPTYGTLYDQTTDLTPQIGSSDWWTWFFGQRKRQTQHIATDLPFLLGADIVISLNGGDTLAVGVLLIGQVTEIGVWVKQGVKVGIQDYSRKETNDFGDTVLVRRAYAKRASFDLTLAAGEVDDVQALLTELRATPCLWIGTSLYEATVVFGIYKQFDILISYPTFADCSLELEGLT